MCLSLTSVQKTWELMLSTHLNVPYTYLIVLCTLIDYYWFIDTLYNNSANYDKGNINENFLRHRSGKSTAIVCGIIFCYYHMPYINM